MDLAKRQTLSWQVRVRAGARQASAGLPSLLRLLLNSTLPYINFTPSLLPLFSFYLDFLIHLFLYDLVAFVCFGQLSQISSGTIK